MKKSKILSVFSLAIAVGMLVVLLASCACSGDLVQKSSFVHVRAIGVDPPSSFVLNEECYVRDCPNPLYWGAAFRCDKDISELSYGLKQDIQKGSDFRFQLNLPRVKIDIVHTFTDRVEYFTIFRTESGKQNTYMLANGAFMFYANQSTEFVHLYIPLFLVERPTELANADGITEGTTIALAQQVTRQNILDAYQSTTLFEIKETDFGLSVKQKSANGLDNFDVIIQDGAVSFRQLTAA